MEKDSNNSAQTNDPEYEPLSTMGQYKLSYSDLSKAPYDLWVLFAIKFCVVGGLSAFFLGLPIYISEVKNQGDMTLSLIYSCAGVTSLIVILLFGSVPDRFGIKLSISIGTLLLFINSGIMIYTTHSMTQFIAIITLGPVGMVLALTAFDVGVKHYTHIHYRSLVISFFTGLTYLGLITAGILLEVIIVYMDKDEKSFRILFIYCASNFLVGLVLSFFLRKLDYSVFEDKELQLKKRTDTFWSHTSNIFALKKFWRLSLLVVLVLTIKIVFYQQTVLLPLYMDRDMNNDSHYGLMVVLNQVIIIFTMPLFNYLNYYLLPYDFFLYGGLIAVLSLVPFLFGASYLTVVLYIVISSIGESLYGPKLLEYSLEISPKGKEGVIMALTTIPSMISSIFAGIIGGVLLNSYCPEDGERHCWMAWLVIGLVALVGVCLLFLLRKWIEEPRFESQPFMPCFKESLDY